MSEQSGRSRLASRIRARLFPASRLEGEVAALRGKLNQLEAAHVEDLAAARRNAVSYGYAYRRLRAAVAGRPPTWMGNVDQSAPSAADSEAHRRAAEWVRERGLLADRLLAGEPLDAAAAGVVRRWVNRGDQAVARSLAHSLLAGPATAAAGQLAAAIVAARTDCPELAWSHFGEVGRPTWRRLALVEFLRTAFRIDPATAVAEVRRLVEERGHELAPAMWLKLVTILLGAGERGLAAESFAVAEELAAGAPEAWRDLAAERDWLRPWLDRVRNPEPPPAVAAGKLAIGIIDYKQPDRSQTPRNLGDYVQTLASLGHLARHQNLRFHGPAELVKVAERVQGRVRQDLRRDGEPREVVLIPVNRDASTFDSVPEPTWTIAFGWYQQSMFGRYDFPFHPNIRPIFISFHCNRPRMLTPAVIDYLRSHGPIGCRDWATVDLLWSAGVPAFFSGCLTTTVGMVFPEPAGDPPADDPVAYVDAAAADRAGAGPSDRVVTHEDDAVREADLASNLTRALDTLESYRHCATTVTSRLHCYLPVRSIGANVEFRPHNPADPRFGGLVGLTDAKFSAMANGIRAKLATVLDAILSGSSEDEIYGRWRAACGEDVARAQARRQSIPQLPPPSFDVAAACAAIRAQAVTYQRQLAGPPGEEVQVALALDGNLKRELRVVVEAMTTNTSRPLRLWILCRDHDRADQELLSRLFPQLTITWLPCDEVDYGTVIGMLRHITVSTMDRLLLPDLLPEVDRILYHDIDALPLGDLAELYDRELADHPLAARCAVATSESSGFANIRRCARRLREDPLAAADLLRRAHARHSFDFVPFNAGILVLDLARMRTDGFCREFIPYVERYGMNDQEVLNCYAGPDRAQLPPEWNALPTQEVVDQPRIVHWAGWLKPWRREYVLLCEVWTEYAQRLEQRVARLAESGG